MLTGSLSPATYPTDATTIRCYHCSRMDRHNRRTPIERYGHHAAMPEVRNSITACERNAKRLTERCKGHFKEL